MQQVDVKRMDESAVVANEPYTALLFSTVLLLLPGPIFQFCLFCCGTFATFSNRVTYGLFLPLGILIFAFVIKCNAVAIFARDLNLRKWVKYGCIVFFALLDWALLPFLAIRKKRPLAMVPAVAVFLLSALSVLMHFQRFQWMLHYYYYINTASFACTCVAIIVLNDGFSRRMAYSLVPLAICIVLLSALYTRKLFIYNEIRQIKSRISKLVEGYPTEVAEFRQLVESGESVEKEPLKSLMKHNADINMDEFPQSTAKASETSEKHAAFIAKHSDFIDAVRKTMERPPHHVAHKWLDDIYSIIMPELSAFRNAARFLSMDMKANAGDRKLIASRNNELMKFRDCMLENTLFISRIVGIAIESIRLDALAFTLTRQEYTQQEFENLLGEQPDWKLFQARSILDEALSHEGVKDYLLSNPFNLENLGGGDGGTTRLMHAVGGFYTLFVNWLDVDLLCGWRFAERDINYALAEKRSYSDIEESDIKTADEMKLEGALLSMMLWPSIIRALRKMDNIMDQRRMALLAWRVMDYRRKNGDLPESLEALGEVPVDSIEGRPFDYRHGELEFEMPYKKDKIPFKGFRIAYAPEDTDKPNVLKAPYILVPLE